MRLQWLLVFGMMVSSLGAQAPAGNWTTGKPNAIGEQKTVIRDASGRITGTATTAKPSAIGEQKSVVRGNPPLRLPGR